MTEDSKAAEEIFPKLHIGDLSDSGSGSANAPRIAGVGKDAPMIVNENGAKQSQTLYRMDLLPPLATLAVAEVLHHGAVKYGENNWHGIPVKDHLNHALIHAYAWLAGDDQDEHLEHAACRMTMALEIYLMEKKGIKSV